MKKIVSSSLLFIMLSLTAFSQANLSAEAKAIKVAEEIKAELISRLGMQATAADNIIVIEAEFHKAMAAIDAETTLKLKEREVKVNRAHVARRAKLMEIPLTGRQMEDVIEVIENIRRKNKL